MPYPSKTGCCKERPHAILFNPLAAPEGTSRDDTAAAIDRVVTQINDPSRDFFENVALGVQIMSASGRDTTPGTNSGAFRGVWGALLSTTLCVEILLA